MTAFIIKSSLSLILLFGLYWFLLREEKLFVFNRFFLLSSLVFSLVMPFISIPVNFQATSKLESLISTNNFVISETNSGDNIITQDLNINQSYNSKPSSAIDISEIFLALYIFGVILFLIRFLRNIFIIIQKIKLFEKISSEEYRIVLTDDKTGPYCFFRNIFLNKEDYLNGRIDKELLYHELEHIRQSHSIDIILIELLKIFYWFNPIHLLYDRAIRLNHEFLADNAVIDVDFDLKSYADKLVSFITGRNNLVLISGSNHSFIKKRLLMMTKTKSKSFNYGIRICLTFILILIFSCAVSFRQSKPQSIKMSFIPQGQFKSKTIIGSDTLQNAIISVGAFYMSNEITNKQFREFVNWANNNPKDSIYQVKFDVAVISDGKTGNMKKTYIRKIIPICISQNLEDLIDQTALLKLDSKYKNYFTDRKYDDYPVVGVSKNMAEYYCIWKTDIENKIRGEQGLSKIHSYRIPEEMEWEYVAQQSGDSINNKKANSIQKSDKGIPNIWGVTHFEDNISEWVNSPRETNGIARGGSWKTSNNISDRHVYDPNFKDGTIGFRIVQSYISPMPSGANPAASQKNEITTKSNKLETGKYVMDTLLTHKESMITDTISTLLKQPSFTLNDFDTIGKKVTLEHVENIKNYLGDKDVSILLGSVILTYGNIEIKADSIVLNNRTNQLFASGRVDKSGKIIGKPIFKQGPEEIEADELTYNFKTHKGFIRNIKAKTVIRH